jgi:hypothetical protein
MFKKLTLAALLTTTAFAGNVAADDHINACVNLHPNGATHLRPNGAT